MIILNRNELRLSDIYTIHEIEKQIESKLKQKENSVQNLMQTSEYQLIRHHIVKILQKSEVYSLVLPNSEVKNDTILIEFASYNTDMFVIPSHKNIIFRFQCCEFNTLDYSGSNLDRLRYIDISHSIIKIFILPSTLQWLELNYPWNDDYDNKITSLSFQSYDITYIAIYRIMPENIFFQDQHINKEMLDFSQFNKLKVLHLDNINLDILLPDYLEKVKISSKSQKFKVLNKTIYGDDIKFRNITLLGKEFPEHSKIRLHSCIIDYILINKLYYQINNDKQSTLVIRGYSSIYEYDNIDKILILNTNVDTISLKSDAQIFIVNPISISYVDNSITTQNLLFPSQNLEGYKELINQNQSKSLTTDVSTQRHPADLSQLTSLKSYCNQRQSYNVLFPAQIQDISLIFNTKNDMDCFQKDSQQPLEFDLSYLTQLQNLSLELFQMESVKLFQGKLQFILQHDQHQKIIIKMQDKQQSQLDFINRVTFIDISRLESIIIDGYKQEVIDFGQFLTLKELRLEKIHQKVILPINLQLLYIKNSSEQDFDLRDYKDLKSVDCLQCQFNNLMTENTVKLNECTIKYFNAEYVKNLWCQWSINSINLCESFDTEFSIVFYIIHIKTLKLNNIENLHELDIRGINCIITNNNTHTEGILDFTIFPNLKKIYLSQVTCFSIKFGVQQEKIDIRYSSDQIKYLDLIHCRQADCHIMNCQIREIALKTSRIKFGQCKINLITLCLPEISYKLSKFSLAYSGQCKFIVQYNKNTKQRVIHKLSERTSQHQKWIYNQKEFMTFRIEVFLACKLEFIWGQISKLIQN